MPTRLCSTSCRLEVWPSTPASTLGFAAASTTTSTARQALEVRREADVAVMERDAERSQRGAILLAAGPNEVVEPDDRDACHRSTQRRISVDPTNPQAPVTRILTKRACCCQASTICANRLFERDGDVPARDSGLRILPRSL